MLALCLIAIHSFPSYDCLPPSFKSHLLEERAIAIARQLQLRLRQLDRHNLNARRAHLQSSPGLRHVQRTFKTMELRDLRRVVDNLLAPRDQHARAAAPK